MKKPIFTEGVLFTLFIFCLTNSVFSQTPRELAERIGSRIIADTKFEFQKSPVKWEQERVAILNFEVLKKFKKGKKWLVYSKIIHPKGSNTEGVLGLSADAGELSIFINNNKIFDKKIETTQAQVERIDYEYIRFSENIPFDLKQDTSVLMLFYTPKTKLGKVYLSLMETESRMTLTSWKFEKWQIERQKLSENKSTIPSWKGLDTFPTPSVSTLANGNQNMVDWRYYNGTLALAIHDTWLHFGIHNFKSYLNNYTYFFIENMPRIRAEREKYGLIDGPFTLYFRGKLLDDWGMQAAAIALSNEYIVKNTLPFKKREDILAESLHRIKDNVPTLPDGTFTRVTPDSLTVQSDDLMMGGYAFLRIGLAQKRPDLIDKAAIQSLNFHKYLLDKNTGLYRHSYSTKTVQQSCCAWGRGMGWMMLVNTELLKNKAPHFEDILNNFKASCEALLKVQNDDGSFNQILTDKKKYLETSATAMFIYAFAEGVNNGWLPKAQYEAAILRGWSYLKTQIQEDGKVRNIVRGTPILPTIDAYNRQKANTNDPRGLGAMLWVCRAMDVYFKK
jgi:Glycosyl Hydrolase Family 88